MERTAGSAAALQALVCRVFKTSVRLVTEFARAPTVGTARRPTTRLRPWGPGLPAWLKLRARLRNLGSLAKCNAFESRTFKCEEHALFVHTRFVSKSDQASLHDNVNVGMNLSFFSCTECIDLEATAVKTHIILEAPIGRFHDSSANS